MKFIVLFSIVKSQFLSSQKLQISSPRVFIGQNMVKVQTCFVFVLLFRIT